jgi:mRNA interferase MazF
MASLSVGNVVFVKFPFSDLSQAKKRPALILANLEKDDFILCQITSRAYADPRAIKINQDNFSTGQLIKTSYVRPSKLFTAHHSLIDTVVAQLK